MGCVRVYVGAHGCVWVCEGVRGGWGAWCGQVCPSVHRCALVGTSVRVCALVYTGVCGSEWMSTSVCMG